MKNCFYEKNKLPRDASVSDLLLTQYIFRWSRSLYIIYKTWGCIQKGLRWLTIQIHLNSFSDQQKTWLLHKQVKMAKISNFGKSMSINIFLFRKSLRGIFTQDLQLTSSILKHLAMMILVFDQGHRYKHFWEHFNPNLLTLCHKK